MKLPQRFVAPVVIAVLLAACAAQPERIAELDQARATVQQLAQDPAAQEAASRELAAAREALQRAEAAFEEGRPQEEVVHLAYLARRRAEIGRARVEETWARQKVAQGEAERNRVLLEARSREAETAQEQAQAAQQQAQSAQQQAEARMQEAEAAREDALAARTELEQMQRQFAELQAKQTERGMVLTLGDVLFDVNEATLKPGADLSLNRLAEFLREHPDTRVIVEGHTDSTGPAEYNEQLSQRRAQAVADALESRGIPRERVEAVGRGQRFPVANNATAAGRQQNRRVEIIFSDVEGRFARQEDEATAGGALR